MRKDLMTILRQVPIVDNELEKVAGIGTPFVRIGRALGKAGLGLASGVKNNRAIRWGANKAWNNKMGTLGAAATVGFAPVVIGGAYKQQMSGMPGGKPENELNY